MPNDPTIMDCGGWFPILIVAVLFVVCRIRFGKGNNKGF